MAMILIVDDDPLMVRMYQKKFEVDGYSVQVASDGKQALENIRVQSPDLILLDIMMPKLNGLEVLKAIKDSEKYKNIPIILLTNVGSSQEDIDRGLELGAVAYLVKASNRPSTVVEKVKEVLAGYARDIPKVKSKIN